MSSAGGPRERFLQRAAETLSSSSPTSAEQFRRDALLLRGSREDTHQLALSECCPACGSIGVESRHVDVKGKRGQPSSAASAAGPGAQARKLLTRECRRCLRSVKQYGAAARATSSRQTAQIPVIEMEAPATDRPATASSLSGTKVSSKKRAKERKDREGLKATMDKSKDKSSAPGFSLMDFMSTKGS